LLSELYPERLSFTGFDGGNGYGYDAEILFGNADATITVSTVLLSASILLLLSGMIGLAGFKRR